MNNDTSLIVRPSGTLSNNNNNNNNNNLSQSISSSNYNLNIANPGKELEFSINNKEVLSTLWKEYYTDLMPTGTDVKKSGIIHRSWIWVTSPFSSKNVGQKVG